MAAARLAQTLLLVAASMAGLPTPQARACGTVPNHYCIGSYVAPTSGMIPATLPAIAFYEYYGQQDVARQVTLQDDQERSLQIAVRRDPGNERHWLIEPLEPLTPGHYRIGYRSSCAPVPSEAVFEVGEPAALPSTAGTVRVGNARRQRVEYKAIDGCQVSGEAAIAPIVFQPSDSMRPWLPVARYTLSVDGKLWASSAYGSERLPLPPPYRTEDALTVLEPYAFCDGRGNEGIPGSSVLGRIGGIPPGRHQAELQVHIAGAKVDPAVISFDFTLDCGGSPAAESAGCTAGGDRTGPTAWWLTALLALALGLHRRIAA